MEEKEMKKKVLAILLGAAMTATMFTGCSSAPAEEATSESEGTTEETGEAEESTSGEDITLTFASYSAIDNQALEAIQFEERFQELYPNVNIEIEEYKDATEYNNAMSIRASAQELPDVMYMKATEFANYKDFLIDMGDMEAATNSLFAEEYAMDGQVCGIATVTGMCYVFYWEDMFAEAGVEVPQTWDEFKQVALDLQAYYEESNPNYISLCVGAKDTWATYPYAEYMPMMENGDGDIFSTMATMDEPFAEGTDVRAAFDKVYDLFNLGVTGPDPLGVGHDQIASVFRAKQAGMIAISSGLVDQMSAAGEDMTGLSSFYLPSRETTDDPHNVVTLADNFLSIPKDGEHVEEAKALVEFFFSEEIYSEFIAEVAGESAMKTVDKELHPALEAANTNSPDAVFVAQIGGNEDYATLEAATKYNCKTLGSEFFITDYDYEGKMDELNAAWTDARTAAGIE